jgi:hypothetical protein
MWTSLTHGTGPHQLVLDCQKCGNIANSLDESDDRDPGADPR